MNSRAVRYSILFAVYLGMSTPALAYLDPATGSILIQAFIGIVATWVLYSKMAVAKAKAFLLRLARRRDSQQTR